MKKASKVAFVAKPLAIAAVLAGACASAQAQTNVTIYGRIDAGINYQSNFTQRDSLAQSFRAAANGAWTATNGAPACSASRATKIWAAV